MVFLVPWLLIGCVAWGMLATPLPRLWPAPFSRERNLPAAVVVGLLGAGYLVGLTVYGVASFRRAGRLLDPALMPLGFAAQDYMLWGRQYSGTMQGRAVSVDFLPMRSGQNALLNVYVEVHLHTRMCVGASRPLLDCRDDPPVIVENLPFQVFAQDEPWARQFLSRTETQAALHRLLSEQKEKGFREIYVQPERLWLRAQPHSLTAVLFASWLNDLLALVDIADER